MSQMSVMINNSYKRLKLIWIDYDVVSMQIGVVLAVNLFFFHQYVNFSRCPFEQDAAGLVGLSVSTITYLISLTGLFSLWVPAGVSFIISNG